jgi:lipopolysaccharide biosynthesis glycosyltransferase
MEDYSNEIAEFWSIIMKAWHEYKDKHPLIECNLLERRVYAYPAKDYINTLSERTRLKTLRQYKQVVAHGGMMVFIVDPERRVLQSYIFNAKDIEPQTKPKKTTKRISK